MIQIKILRRNHRTDTQSPAYDLAYKMWLDTWTPEYSAIDPQMKVFSDAFTRQDEILTIWVGTECAALTFFHVVDLSRAHGRNDSYFEPWPGHVLDQLVQIQPEIFVCSALTVARSFQGKSTAEGIPFKDLLAAASLEHLKMSPHAFMVGNMRNTRGANHLVYKFGAKLLETVICKGEPSDLVLFERDRLPAFPPLLQNLLDEGFLAGTDLLKPRRVA